MTAEDRNRYGVDVAEIHPGSMLFYRDVAVVAVDWPDLQNRTVAVAYLRRDYTAGMEPDLSVSIDDVSA